MDSFIPKTKNHYLRPHDHIGSEERGDPTLDLRRDFDVNEHATQQLGSLR